MSVVALFVSVIVNHVGHKTNNKQDVDEQTVGRLTGAIIWQKRQRSAKEMQKRCSVLIEINLRFVITDLLWV